MKIHPAAPNTLDWLQARCGVITASEFNQLVTDDFQKRTGEMRRSYLARKLAEKWLGSPLAGFQSVDMEIGTLLETEAIPYFELERNESVQRVGLITNDAGTIGCSPDGLLSDDSGIEIKCPRPETHVKYLIAGTLPKDYAAQVHGAMFVTGRARWVFMSYCRRFPAFILTINRDEKIQEWLAEILRDSIDLLDFGYAKLCTLNGGPPKRPTFQYVPKPEPAFVPSPTDQLV